MIRSAILSLDQPIERLDMSKFLIAGTVLAGLFAISASEASAAVCARGARGVACVSPRGAAAVRRPIYPRRTTVMRGPRGAAVIAH